MLAFYMTADTACKIYDAFMKENAVTELDRLNILMRYKDEIRGISHSKRTKEQFIKDLSKQFKVARVENKGSGL